MLLKFPELSRGPDVDEDEDTIDPTLRDPMENGDEDTAMRFTRGRRQWNVKYSWLTLDDKQKLDQFIATECSYGALPFEFPDTSQLTDPETRTVKFAKLPSWKRTEKVQADGEPDGTHRYNLTFTLREE